MSVKKEKRIDLSKSNILDIKAEFYDNANDVVEDCKSRKLRHSDYDVGTSFKSSWEGVKTYDEALDLLKNGYQSAVDSFRNELKVTGGIGPRFAFNNNVFGFVPVVPLALKGVPECMVNMTLRPLKAKVLDVYYDIGVIAKYSAEDIVKAGKAVLGTILELERQGYRFNLYAVQTYWGSGYGRRFEGTDNDSSALDMLCVKVKSSNTPLDLKRMSFPLVHPAFFRVIGFDWQGKSPVTRYIGSGRGRDFATHYDAKQVKKVITELFGNNACYIAACKVIDSKFDREKLKEVFTDVSPRKA